METFRPYPLIRATAIICKPLMALKQKKKADKPKHWQIKRSSAWNGQILINCLYPEYLCGSASARPGAAHMLLVTVGGGKWWISNHSYLHTDLGLFLYINAFETFTKIRMFTSVPGWMMEVGKIATYERMPYRMDDKTET